MECKIKLKDTKEIVQVYKEFDYNERKWKYYKRNSDTKEEYERGTFEEIIPTPFELFGVECGKGWYELLKPIFNYIEEYNKDKNEDERLVPEQIKEKWGQLNVYMNFCTDELRKLIREAEEEASKTCELCGSKEDIGTACEGWIMTECHSCMKEWCKKHERPHRWKRHSDMAMYWVHPDRDDEVFQLEKEKN